MSGVARILVVDDEPQIHRFLRPTLEAAGYDVELAHGGAEALRLAATRSPDLILLDLGLPDLDGQEVLKRLRQFTKVPVVVLSARDRPAEKITALDAGADDYVEKPFDIGELFARIRVALRHGLGSQASDGIFSNGPLEVEPAAPLGTGRWRSACAKPARIRGAGAACQERWPGADTRPVADRRVGPCSH